MHMCMQIDKYIRILRYIYIIYMPACELRFCSHELGPPHLEEMPMKARQ